MSKITPCLWFDGEAEQAAELYVSLFPDSRIDKVQRNPPASPAGGAGSVLVVEFTLAGQRYIGLNGGMKVEHTIAMSLSVSCADQAEVDRLWDGLIAGGGAPSRCGWLKDRWGVNWQITPAALPRLLGGPDREAANRAFQAMLTMTRLDVATLQRAYDGG